MNVIFLDFDGVLATDHFDSNDDIEKRIITLANICMEYDCKVVIEAGSKNAIDEDTLEVLEGSWINVVFDLFKRNKIECIGRTPNIEKDGFSMWKEDEILEYLKMHPEIKHYCVIDDDDMKSILHRKVSDLDKVRDHLVETIFSSDNPEEEGLLPKHKYEVGKILKKTIN